MLNEISVFKQMLRSVLRVSCSLYLRIGWLRLRSEWNCQDRERERDSRGEEGGLPNLLE